jgi:hypothetical protein
MCRSRCWFFLWLSSTKASAVFSNLKLGSSGRVPLKTLEYWSLCSWIGFDFHCKCSVCQLCWNHRKEFVGCGDGGCLDFPVSACGRQQHLFCQQNHPAIIIRVTRTRIVPSRSSRWTTPALPSSYPQAQLPVELQTVHVIKRCLSTIQRKQHSKMLTHYAAVVVCVKVELSDWLLDYSQKDVHRYGNTAFI